MRVAIYARYSSDNQRDASIADQIRICRTFAQRERWTIADEFHDHAISGATLLRPGFQALMRRAFDREFDVVLAESLDRFSRDQEDTAGLFKRLTFLGVRIVTLAEGEITHLHVGFKGTMNALCWSAPLPLRQQPFAFPAGFTYRVTLRIRRLLMSTPVPPLSIWVATAFFMYVAPADAQFRPRPLNEPATGEEFHIEASVAIWRPSADIAISSELFGILPTTIDFKRDLGLTDQTLPEFKFTLRPFRNHKLRAQVIPMTYESSTRLLVDIVFNGQRYGVNLPVNWTLDWTAWRFNYEFDFITKNRGFAGFILEMRYNDVKAELTTVGIQEFTRRRFPLPAMGGIARIYVVPGISITGEMTGFKVPGRIGDVHDGNWADVDIYGTANFTRNVGAQIGFRSMDLGYEIKSDTASLTLKGIYFGIVARY